MTTPPLDLPAERITALRDIANAATDGPWVPADDDGWIGGPRCFIVSSDEDSINDAGRPIKVAYRSPGDAAHIAAFDPPTVLRLLDRVEESYGLLARLSASGGRNIDLLTRAEAAERDLAAVTVSRDGWQPRAEAAEKKVAAVMTVIHGYGEQTHSEECGSGDCCRCTLDDMARALDARETETTP